MPPLGASLSSRLCALQFTPARKRCRPARDIWTRLSSRSHARRAVRRGEGRACVVAAAGCGARSAPGWGRVEFPENRVEFPENREMSGNFSKFPSIFNALRLPVHGELPSSLSGLRAEFPAVCGTGNSNRQNREKIARNSEPVRSPNGARPAPKRTAAVAKRNGEILIMTKFLLVAYPRSRISRRSPRRGATRRGDPAGSSTSL